MLRCRSPSSSPTCAAKIGHDLLWLSAVTAVVRRDDDLLLVQRADTRRWTPVTGVLDPGEEPAVGAAREALEETGVRARADRVASVSGANRVTLLNHDRAVYLDVTSPAPGCPVSRTSPTTSRSTCGGGR